MSDAPLRGVVVGCRMGAAHAGAMARRPEYELVAVCDRDEATARKAADRTGGPRVYTDYTRMLAETRPDVVAIATPNDSHAALTEQAAEAGARGVYCEKPMATCLREARRMVEACRARGTALAVNHQRRVSAAYVTMRRLIAERAIGDLYLLRGTCAGDVLSDGTHTVDLLLHLAGDPEVTWVLGQVYRERPDPAAPRGMGYDASGGWRYGHPIENGALASLQLASGVRAEVLTGGMWFPGRRYQDIEAFGTEGRLWRAGDQADPPLLMQDRQAGGWRPVALDPVADGDMGEAYRLFARTVETGEPHPLGADNALRGFEVVMAIYESARLRARLDLPLQQDRYPLEVMIEEGLL